MPDRPPTPGRLTTTVLRTRKNARVTWASICAYLSDYTLMAVPTRTDDHTQPQDFIEMARRAKLACQEWQFAAVCNALEEGCTWDQVATACGLPDADAAKVIYQEPYQAWARGDNHPWAPCMRAAIPEGAYGDPDAEAARLDEWYIQRSHGDGSLVPGLRPVTDGLY